MSIHQRRIALAHLIRNSLSPASLARGSVSAIALGAIAMSSQVASAQGEQAGAKTEGAEDVQEVVVTGIRSSLESSQEIKKSAEVFVDSVTAEDIGAMPDRSITEVLQRIPGVAINRFAGANDPDHFSIEGSGVVVRGLNQVLEGGVSGREVLGVEGRVEHDAVQVGVVERVADVGRSEGGQVPYRVRRQLGAGEPDPPGG